VTTSDGKPCLAQEQIPSNREKVARLILSAMIELDR